MNVVKQMLKFVLGILLLMPMITTMWQTHGEAKTFSDQKR